MNYIPQGASDHSAVAQVVEKQQNEARLRSCRGPVHKFVREVARADPSRSDEPRIVDYRTPPGAPRQQIAPTGMMRCELCYGRATQDQAAWYALGVLAGMNIEPPSRRRILLAFDDGLDGKKGIV